MAVPSINGTYGRRPGRGRPIVHGLALLGGCVLLSQSCAAPELRTDPSSEIEVHPSLEVTLFAAEPDVVDPVALTFDENGRMYVVEMRDYPLGMDGEGTPGSTIRRLEDSDGDGRADTSVVFAEGLSFATSIAAWRGGVFVTAPPQILYLRDEDGDGRADRREVFFDGFHLGVTDSNLNGLRWGLDNRLHVSNGGNGGEVARPGLSEEALSIRGLDLSFDPETREARTTFHTSGGFGLVFDEWGRSFSTYNIDHLQQRILEARYLDAEPGLRPIRATRNVSRHGPMARIYPISEPETRVNHPEQSGYYSSAGGMGVLDFAEPGAPTGILVCDVVGNLVSREVIHGEGPVFATRRDPAAPTREFLASRNPWFRPVGAEMGPDGALYVPDMHRAVIEHPDYVPQKVLDTLDVREGSDRGRIYRVAVHNGEVEPRPALGQASDATLIATLSHARSWWRATAQRLLVERGSDHTEALAALASRGEFALGRLHALWTLEGLGALDEGTLLAALGDRSPEVRENAVALAEPLADGSDRLRAAILERAYDEAVGVRFRAALATSSQSGADAREAVAAVYRRDAGQKWMRVAAAVGLREKAVDLAIEMLHEERRAGGLDALRELADLVGGRDSLLLDEAGVLDETGVVLRAVDADQVGAPARRAVLEGLADGLERARENSHPARSDGSGLAGPVGRLWSRVDSDDWTSAKSLARISRTLGGESGPVESRFVTAALDRLGDETKSAEERASSASFLALSSRDDVAGVLLEALDATQPIELQQASLEAYAAVGGPEAGPAVLARWRSFSPALRPLVLRFVLRDRRHHGALLDALESGAIALGELSLDLEQRRRLLRHSTPEVEARAARLLTDEEYGNRSRVVEEWMRRLPARGDAEAGGALFQRLCAQCHRAGETGFEVGPDAASLAHRSVEDLLSNILDPNMAIAPRYAAVEVRLDNGETFTGIPQAETGTAVRIRMAFGEEKIVSREAIVQLEAGRLSLMPEGLEAGLEPADLRDLIAFVQSLRKRGEMGLNGE